MYDVWLIVSAWVSSGRVQFNEIYAELEDQRELATSRMNDVEKLQAEYQEKLKEIEKLKMDVSVKKDNFRINIFTFKVDLLARDFWVFLLTKQLATLPEGVVVETTEYKCLQSQFSVLYNESMQMKTQIEEMRALLLTTKNVQQQQVEQMEVLFWSTISKEQNGQICVPRIKIWMQHQLQSS